MALTDQKCLAPVSICALRVTKLDSLGHVAAGPNNGYVTDSLTELQVNPEIKAGDEIELANGCGCDIVDYKNDDILKRFTLQVTLGKLSAALQSLLLGGDVIYNAASPNPVPIGMHWPLQQQCSTVGQPNVAVEAWSKAVDYDHQDSDYPYVHFIWPWVKFQLGQFTLGSAASTIPVSGFTRQNPNWVLGPWGDVPQAIEPNGSWFYAASIPTAHCGFLNAGS